MEVGSKKVLRTSCSMPATSAQLLVPPPKASLLLPWHLPDRYRALMPAHRTTQPSRGDALAAGGRRCQDQLRHAVAVAPVLATGTTKAAMC
mmetsp:Transcript_21514/g.62304  ORF Transcript_21514/g.62304 Transcript_21514/m.62304 type:complete len:91 (+) Transcript_21514:908-1180(+)